MSISSPLRDRLCSAPPANAIEEPGCGFLSLHVFVTNQNWRTGFEIVRHIWGRVILSKRFFQRFIIVIPTRFSPMSTRKSIILKLGEDAARAEVARGAKACSSYVPGHWYQVGASVGGRPTHPGSKNRGA